MRKALVLSLLLSVRLLAAGRDVAEPEFAPAGGYEPRVATNGSTFLTVWTVNRQQAAVLFASVAAADGTLLTPTPIPLFPIDSLSADVVPIGSDYLAIWHDNTGGLHTRIISSDAKATREGPSIPLRIGGPIAVATNGSSILIVAPYVPGAGAIISAHLFALDGTLLKRNIPISSQYAPFDAAVVDGEYAIGTVEATGAVVTRIDPGTFATSRTMITAQSTIGEAAAIDNGVMVWAELPNRDFYAPIVRAANIRKGAVPAVHELGGVRPNYRTRLDVAPFGDGHVVVANSTPKGRVIRLSADAELLTDTPITAAQLVVTNDSTIFVVGQTYDGGPVYGSAVHDVSLQTIEPPQALSIMLTGQSTPSIASNGTDFLVTWSDTAIGTRVVTRDAVPAGDTRKVSGYVLPKAVAFNGSEYLVVTYPSNSAVLQRFDRSGAPVGQPQMLRDRSVRAVTAAGSSFALLTSSVDGDEVVLLAADGTLSTPVHLPNEFTLPGHYNLGEASIAFDGQHFLITRAIGPALVDPIGFVDAIDGFLITADRFVAGPFAIANPALQARVAAGRDGFLVAVQQRDAVAVVPVRVDGDQPVIGPMKTLFEFAFDAVAGVDIAARATDYVLTWSYGVGPNWRLAVAHANAAGIIGRIATVPIGSPERNLPAIAINDAGEVVVVNSDARTPADSVRLRAYREDEFEPIPAPPASPTNVFAFAGTVMWQSSDPTVLGFSIETIDTLGQPYVRTTVLADARSFTSYYPFTAPVRVRALGVGGISAETPFVPITSPPRRRATR